MGCENTHQIFITSHVLHISSSTHAIRAWWDVNMHQIFIASHVLHILPNKEAWTFEGIQLLQSSNKLELQ